jgi:hypothetical protein
VRQNGRDLLHLNLRLRLDPLEPHILGDATLTTATESA